MQGIFPDGLIACIREGRPPLPNEVSDMSSKLWEEGLAYQSHPRPDLVQEFAKVALLGCPAKLDLNENELS